MCFDIFILHGSARCFSLLSHVTNLLDLNKAFLTHKGTILKLIDRMSGLHGPESSSPDRINLVKHPHLQCITVLAKQFQNKTV